MSLRYFTKATLMIDGKAQAAFILGDFPTYEDQARYHQGTRIQLDTRDLMDKCEVMFGKHETMAINLDKVANDKRGNVL
ncbi:hypothetical protein IVIADoCa7_10 [Xanthomonas phage vB_Xar_IVIA-DoCa7]|uniref:Uncharacterized protein n=1 Tax=Xanthomonas phage vB_Xar_IVIA-DoCa7 TaxID=2975534 RepID=A0A9X9JN11_9CAUD|nr:hypothetical protein IVIADoCa7_10 [Xanthomonas phage vB_Xar_IVIA-DoCa7]